MSQSWQAVTLLGKWENWNMNLTRKYKKQPDVHSGPQLPRAEMQLL